MAFDLNTIIGSNLGQAFKDIMSVFKVDPTTALQNRTELEKLQYELQGKLIDQITAQIEVDRQEAQNTNMFVAGWRPFCGWICGMGLGIQFVVNPIATWIASLLSHPIAFPALDLGTLMTLLFGMLGLGGLRSFEKVSSAPGTDKLH